MLLKFYIQIGGDRKVDINSQNCMDVSKLIANIGEVQMTYMRIDLGGVVRKCGSSIEFIGDAKNLLLEHYREYGLASAVVFAVYKINNDWTYSLFFTCPLDFSTFKYDSNKVIISCLDDSVAAIIRANKSTKYEYNVEAVKAGRQLDYDSVAIRKEVEGLVCEDGYWYPNDTYNKFIDINIYTLWLIPQIYIEMSENISFVLTDQTKYLVEIDKSDYDDWNKYVPNSCTMSYFAECVREGDVSVTIQGHSDGKNYYLYKITTGGNLVELAKGIGGVDGVSSKFRLSWSGHVKVGEKLQYAILLYRGSRHFSFYENIRLELVWSDRKDCIKIDVIKPVRLLERLLFSLNGDKVGIYGDIKETVQDQYGIEKYNNRLKESVLVAAESIRGFFKAKVYTSFSDFCKWMEAVFGYIYIIEYRKKLNSYYEDKFKDIIYNFSGFNDAKINVESPELTAVYFSLKEHFFVQAIQPPGYPHPTWYYADEKFQTRGQGGAKVNEENYFFCIENRIIYQGHSSLVDGRYINILEEIILDIDAKDFQKEVSFGGVLLTVPKDSGACFSQHIEQLNIQYVRDRDCFFYKDGEQFYSTFPMSSLYNVNGKARKDFIFKCKDKSYIYVAGSLVQCTVKGDVSSGELVPFVVFKHRDEVFARSKVKKIYNYSSLEYAVSPSRIYASIQIGYAKQNYEMDNNGNDEFNFSNTYTTGVKLNDRKLSLISPFRADSYGVEELSRRRGEDSNANNSDQQVFVILCHCEDNRYVVDRTHIVNGAYSNTIFNAGLSPLSMIEANRRYLSSFAEKLTFTSSDGCSDIVIDSQKVTSDIYLDSSDRLMGVGTIRFSTDDYLIPNWEDTIVELEWSGIRYAGYLNNLECDAASKEAFVYELLEI